MFTGIVEELGIIIGARSGSLVIGAGEVLKGMKHGASIAVNGACLTVTDFDASSFSVDVMPETLKRTNLRSFRAGDKVNLERPMALGGQLGGHLVQGHVDGIGKIASSTRDGGVMLIRMEAPPEVMRFTVPKGFVAVDGISLTIVNKDSGSFQVSVVDYTGKHTTLNSKKIGDQVNLEIDIIAKYVEQLGQAHNSGITTDFLKQHGFAVN